HDGGNAAAGFVDVHAQPLELRQRAQHAALAVNAASGVAAIENPQWLVEQAAQRRQSSRLVGHRVAAAAAHERDVGLAAAQQLQVVGGAVGGFQHHVDAVDG